MRATRGRRSSAVAVLCVVSAVLVACSDAGPGATPTPSPPSSSSSSTVPPRPLQLAVHGVAPAVAAYREVAEAFTEETGVPVELQVRPDAAASAAQVEEDLDSPSPGADVFLLDHEFLPQVVATGQVQPVDQALEERGLQFGDGYQRVALTAFSAEDRLQCMPVDMSPFVMFVNRDDVRPRDLEIRGVPLPTEGRWGFEAFDAAARVVAREHADEPGFHAVHLPVDIDVLTAMVRSAGGEVVDDVDQPTQLTLDSDEAREALTGYIRLARESSISLTEEGATRRSALERFAGGDLAMMFGTRADVPELRESGVRFDVMALPTFGSYRTVADIGGLCVDARSSQVEAALDLVAFAAGNQGSTTLARSGAVVPANLDVVFSPAFAQRGQPPRSVRMFSNALDRSSPMPYSTGWREVGERVERFVRGLVADRRNVARMLERRLPVLGERLQDQLLTEEQDED